jgi:hypothetical protein
MATPGGGESGERRGSVSSCPICGKPAVARFRPFCSARCQTIDLARWIGGNYRVPSAEEAPPSEDTDDAD